MRLIIAPLLAGSALAPAADLPNPDVGECEIADIVVTRTNPTFMDSDGAVTGIRIWQVCSYQTPAGESLRTIDEEFPLDIDLEAAELLVGAADELLADGVYAP